jgi:hypothetical protein
VKKAVKAKTRKRKPGRIVHLDDLAPRKAVAGRARRLWFGERLNPLEDQAHPAPKKRSLPPE